MFLVLRVYRRMEEELDETCADNENLEFDGGIYLSFETYRVSRPKKFFRFALLWVNVGLFLHMAYRDIGSLGELSAITAICGDEFVGILSLLP